MPPIAHIPPPQILYHPPGEQADHLPVYPHTPNQNLNSKNGCNHPHTQEVPYSPVYFKEKYRLMGVVDNYRFHKLIVCKEFLGRGKAINQFCMNSLVDRVICKLPSCCFDAKCARTLSI
jgi:hypothetical protein